MQNVVDPWWNKHIGKVFDLAKQRVRLDMYYNFHITIIFYIVTENAISMQLYFESLGMKKSHDVETHLHVHYTQDMYIWCKSFGIHCCYQKILWLPRMSGN